MTNVDIRSSQNNKPMPPGINIRNSMTRKSKLTKIKRLWNRKARECEWEEHGTHDRTGELLRCNGHALHGCSCAWDGAIDERGNGYAELPAGGRKSQPQGCVCRYEYFCGEFV